MALALLELFFDKESCFTIIKLDVAAFLTSLPPPKDVNYWSFTFEDEAI